MAFGDAAMAKMTRPEEDFWAIDLKSDLDVVSRHTKAGFDPIPDEIVRLRLFILLDFLGQKKLLKSRMVKTVADVKPETALWNRHLTDDGYYFLQKYIDKWYQRMHKHTNADKERGFLAKWYQKFKESSERP